MLECSEQTTLDDFSSGILIEDDQIAPSSQRATYYGGQVRYPPRALYAPDPAPALADTSAELILHQSTLRQSLWLVVSITTKRFNSGQPEDSESGDCKEFEHC